MKIRKVMVLMLALLMTMLLPGLSQAETAAVDTSSQSGITIQQAVDMALLNSSSIKMDAYNVQSAQITLDKASDRVGYMPTGQADEVVIQAVSSLMSANISWSMARKTQDMEKDKIVYSVFKDYMGVLQALESLNTAQEAMSNANRQLLIDSTSFQIGVISQYQLDTDKLQYKNVQNALASAQIGLENAYHSLNQDIGLQPGDRPNLLEKPGYSKLVIDNVEAAAHRATEASPSIWLVDQKIDVAKMQLDLSEYSTTTGQDYQSRKIEIDKAQLTASSARDSMEQAIRTLYNSIISLEESYVYQQEAVKNAEATLKVVKLKYDLGMVTKTDLQTAQLSLDNARKSLNATIYQHEQLKLAFEKPWAY